MDLSCHRGPKKKRIRVRDRDRNKHKQVKKESEVEIKEVKTETVEPSTDNIIIADIPPSRPTVQPLLCPIPSDHRRPRQEVCPDVPAAEFACLPSDRAHEARQPTPFKTSIPVLPITNCPVGSYAGGMDASRVASLAGTISAMHVRNKYKHRFPFTSQTYYRSLIVTSLAGSYQFHTMS